MDVISALRNAADEVVVSPFDELKKITVPTLRLMGDRERGSIVSPEVAQEMAKALPGLQIAHLKGANHDIRRAKFEEYMQVLRKFLDEV